MTQVVQNYALFHDVQGAEEHHTKNNERQVTCVAQNPVTRHFNLSTYELTMGSG